MKGLNGDDDDDDLSSVGQQGKIHVDNSGFAKARMRL